MTEVQEFVSRLLEHLGREEQQVKRLGLHAQAAGIRQAIVIAIRESLHANPSSIEPESE